MKGIRVKEPEKIPPPPKPAMARPAMSVLLFFATPVGYGQSEILLQGQNTFLLTTNQAAELENKNRCKVGPF